MQVVVGVRFKKAGKIYYFDPVGLELVPGEHVIVETARGLEYGEVASRPKEVNPEEIVSPLKPVVRKATPEDRMRVQEYEEKRKYAFLICARQIAAHDLQMKLIDVEYTFDGSKVIFYFTAEGRVDFRELVKDLASILKMRIELRQIGVRDRAKMLGGLGPCGRPLCCVTFLGDFEPVSIKMAKDQSLSLNPTKISGTCGRLMCCLKFESDFYKEARSYLPVVGKEISTPEGCGKVIEVNALKGKFKVGLPDGRTIELDAQSQAPCGQVPVCEMMDNPKEESKDASALPEEGTGTRSEGAEIGVDIGNDLQEMDGPAKAAPKPGDDRLEDSNTAKRRHRSRRFRRYPRCRTNSSGQNGGGQDGGGQNGARNGAKGSNTSG